MQEKSLDVKSEFLWQFVSYRENETEYLRFGYELKRIDWSLL